MWERWRRCYPLQLELFSLVLVFLCFYIAFSNYSSLPDQIPMHFNASGNPDDYGSKAWILSFPIASAVVFLLFTALNILFAAVKDPRRFINLPSGKKATEVLTETQGEAIRVFVNRYLFVLKLIMLGLFTYLAWQTVEIAFGRSSSMGFWLWLFVVAILAVSGYMIWKLIILTRTRDGIAN